MCVSSERWEVESKLRRKSTDYFSVIDHFVLINDKSMLVERKVFVPLLKSICRSSII